MNPIRYLAFSAICSLLWVTASGQTDFNPASPGEPATPAVPASKYGLVLQAEPATGGSPSGGGTYEAGKSVSLNAKTASNFSFVNWTDTRGNIVSSASSFSYTTKSEPDTLIAHYTFIPGSPGEPSRPDTYYTLVAKSTPGGSVSGGGRYLPGSRVRLRATASGGYTFRNWTDPSGSAVSTSADFYYTVQEKNDTLTANFVLQPFNPSSPSEPSPAPNRVTVTASCSQGGTYSGNTGTFTEGAAISLRATANTGYRFVGWYVNGELFATTTSLSYTAGTADLSIYAQFEFRPSSPGEPSTPPKENSLYLMTINGLPGQEKQIPVYLANQDTLGDMTFQVTFSNSMLPDIENYTVSHKAEGYTVSHTVIDDTICKFTFTGGKMLPGNTPLLTFNIPIGEETALGSAFQMKINQVSVSNAEGTGMAASTHNGMLRVGRSSWLKLTLDDLTSGDAINLGLSVKWASRNVGTMSADEFGDYHLWNDVSHSPSSVFGSGWRMPTAEEVNELLTCYRLWTTLEGVPGMLFISQNAVDILFIPAAGRYTPSSTDTATDAGMSGYYWSSTSDQAGLAYALTFSETDARTEETDMEGIRLPLRAVYDKNYLEGDFSTQEIENPTPGALEEETVKPDDIIELKVRGGLNGTDIAFIRSLKKLRILDISEANIVAGGSAYYSSFHTADDVAGDSMFCLLPNLWELRLCTSVKSIGQGMLAQSTGITSFDIPESVQDAGNDIFAGCTRLRYINWLAKGAKVPESLFGDMPSNCLVYAADGVTSDFTGNIIIGGMAERITLHDARPFFCPTTFRTKSVSYSRSFSKETTLHAACGWESLVLPFDVQTITSEERGELSPFNSGNAGTRPFWLAELTGNGFSHTASIKANRPYIIAMPNSSDYEEEFNIRGTVTFSATDNEGILIEPTSSCTVSTGPDFELVPTYETVIQSDTVYAINNEEYDGMLPGAAFVCNNRPVLPFEAYARSVAPLLKSPLYYSIGDNIGETNGIERICHHTSDEVTAYSRGGILYIESPRNRTLGLYSADGRLMRLMHLSEGLNQEYGLEHGVYFIGKTKVVVR